MGVTCPALCPLARGPFLTLPSFVHSLAFIRCLDSYSLVTHRKLGRPCSCVKTAGWSSALRLPFCPQIGSPASCPDPFLPSLSWAARVWYSALDVAHGMWHHPENCSDFHFCLSTTRVDGKELPPINCRPGWATWAPWGRCGGWHTDCEGRGPNLLSSCELLVPALLPLAFTLWASSSVPLSGWGQNTFRSTFPWLRALWSACIFFLPPVSRYFSLCDPRARPCKTGGRVPSPGPQPHEHVVRLFLFT